MPEFGYVFALFAIVAIVGLFLVMRRSSQQPDDLPAYSPSVLSSSDFRLTIEDTFTIKGRGLVVVGRIETGSLTVGQRVQITSADGSENYQSQVKGIEAFHKQIASAQAGDNVGLMLSDLTKNQIKPGMIITSIP